MGSILDDPKVRQAIYPISVEFYRQASQLGLLGKNVELLEGTLVQKMAKSPFHEWLIAFLHDLILRVLPAGFVIRKEGPIAMQASEPEPDLAVVRGTLGDFRHAHPVTAELVIEVAVSSLAVDRQKALIYAAAGVAEYWLIIPEEARVEVRRGPGPNGYSEESSLAAPANLTSRVVPNLTVDLAALFRS